MRMIKAIRNWIKGRASSAARKRPGGLDSLLSVAVDASSLCNIRCRTCSLREWYPRKGNMTLQTFRRLRDVLPRIRHLALSNSAEPLMNPDLEEMVRLARKWGGPELVTSINTNGMLLDERRAFRLIKEGLSCLEFSLDGARPATFERIRSGANFERVTENIRTLFGVKQRLRRANPYVSARFVLFEENASELIEVLELAHSLGIRHVVVNGLEPYDREMAGRVLYGTPPDPETARLFDIAEERARALGMRLDLPALSPGPELACHSLMNCCIVLWDGTVVPCSPFAYPRPFFFFGKELERPCLSFGNIREASLLAIWKSDEYARFRKQVLGGSMPEFCDYCLYRMGVLCPLEHYRWVSRIGCGQEEVAGRAGSPSR